MKATKLEWDSQFFGYNVAQVTSDHVTNDEMDQIIGWCERENIRLLQFKCSVDNQENIELAERYKFNMLDMRIVYRMDLSSDIQGTENQNHVRRATLQDQDALKSMTKDLFQKSRYYFDKRFDPKKVDLFYENWVTKAIDGRFDDGAYVYEDQNIKGYITYREDDDTGRIGLIGVGLKYLGKGVASSLLQQVISDFKQKGYKYIEVITQGRNIDAQRLYQKNGFFTEAVQVYYHKWF